MVLKTSVSEAHVQPVLAEVEAGQETFGALVSEVDPRLPAVR